MESTTESSPVVKKIKKSGGGHHGGAWKVAYADFVTAMMALFIVLWVLSQSEAVQKAVAEYFKDPIGFSSKTKNLIDGKGQLSSIGFQSEEEKRRKEAEKEEFNKTAKKLLDDLKADTDLLGFSHQIEIQMTQDGMRIELVDNANDLFFEIGTSELKAKAKKLIEKIGSEIAKLSNKIIVEGHTDARQFNNKGTGFTNFELSAERALAAKRALVEGGLPEKQIDEIHGYADTRLRDKKNPFSFINRRISITVKFKSK